MKLNYTKRSLLGPGIVLFAAQSSLAQIAPPGGYGTASPPHTFTGPFEDTDRIVFGPTVGDLIPGAAVLAGGKVFGLFDPAFHKTVFDVEVGQTVTDMDLVPPAVSDGSAGFALALGGEVWLYEVDTDPNGSAPFVETLLHTFGSDVDMLRAGDVDGDGDQDLMCVLGAQLKFLIDTGSGWSTSSNLDFTASGTPREVAAMRWDVAAPTTPFVAVQLAQSVEIWRLALSQPPSFVLDETFLAAASGGYMALMPATTTDPVERLAWSSPLPNVQPEQQVLMVLSKGGQRELCGQFKEGNPSVNTTPNALVSGVLTLNNSSRADLLTTALLDDMVRVYPYVTPDYYELAAPWVIGATGSPSPSSFPGFGDATGDGIPDAMVANGDLYFFTGQESRLAHGTILDPINGEDAWSDPTLSENGSSDSWFDITVDLPSTGSFTYVQILLWESADGLYLERQTKKNYVYEIEQLVPDPVTGYFPLRLSLEGVQACNTTPPLFAGAYYVSLRLIQLSGTDQIVAASEAIHGGFAADPTVLPNLVGGEPVEVAQMCGATAASRPSFVPLAALPPIENGLPPQILPIETGGQP